MKTGILKKFLNGASVVVVSLLATINPSSAKVPSKWKPSFAARSVAPKGKSSFAARPAAAKGKLSFAARSVAPKGKSSFAARPAAAKGKPSFAARSVVAPKKPTFAARPVAAPKKPIFAARPVAAPKKPSVAARPVGAPKKPSVVTRSVVAKGKPAFAARPVAAKGKPSVAARPVVAPKKPSVVTRSVVAPEKPSVVIAKPKAHAPKEMSALKKLPFLAVNLAETQRAAKAKQQAILHQQEVARQQVVALQRQQAAALLQRQQEEERWQAQVLQQEAAWANLMPDFIIDPLVKHTTPITVGDLRWEAVKRQLDALIGIDGAVGRQGHLLAFQAPRILAKSNLVPLVGFATAARRALFTRDDITGVESTDPHARSEAFTDRLGLLEDMVRYFNGLAPLPAELNGPLAALNLHVPTLRVALGGLTPDDRMNALRQPLITAAAEAVEEALQAVNTYALAQLDPTDGDVIALRQLFVDNHEDAAADELDKLGAIGVIDHQLRIALDLADVTSNPTPELYNASDYLGIKLARDVLSRATHAGPSEDYPAFDLGYGLGQARTHQYERTMSMPAAPVFHAYQPGHNTVGFDAPAFSLNLKLPAYTPDMGLEAINGHLRRLGIPLQNVDAYVISQDMPWTSPLLLRPQGWLFPDAPFSDNAPYNRATAVVSGVFSRHAGAPLLVGQNEDGLLAPQGVSIHNGLPDPQVVSSPNNLNLHRFNKAESQVLFSLTVHQGRAAVVKHLLLNAQDQEVLKGALMRPGVDTLGDIVRELQAVPTRARLSPGGQRLVDDELDLM